MAAELKNGRFTDILLWLLRRRRRFRVSGSSMEPLLRPDDEVLVNPQAPPRPGDIIVARHPYRTDVRLIKRVAAVDERGRCLLQGDNPAESTDSRSFGYIPPDDILGRVVSRFP